MEVIKNILTYIKNLLSRYNKNTQTTIIIGNIDLVVNVYKQ